MTHFSQEWNVIHIAMLQGHRLAYMVPNDM